MPEPFDAVLLDLYDTIVWSEWFRLRDAIAARIGDDMEADRLQKAFEQTRPARGVGAFGSVEGDMAAVLEAAGRAVRSRRWSTNWSSSSARTSPTASTSTTTSFPVLASLRERGVKTALVSNCSHSTRPVVERLGLDEAFDRVVLSFEVRAMKPDPAIYRDDARAARRRRRRNAPCSSTISHTYCDGATAVGLDARLILRKNEDVPADRRGHQVVTDLGWLL